MLKSEILGSKKSFKKILSSDICKTFPTEFRCISYLNLSISINVNKERLSGL